MSIKAIHTLKGMLHLSDPEYRALLMRVAGVGSSRLLTKEQDRAVMGELEAMRTTRRNSASTREKSPSEAKIWALWYALKPYLPGEERNVAYLMGIAGRVIGKPALQPSELPLLDGRESYKIIEALKQRVEQEENKIDQEIDQQAEVPF